MLSILRRCPQLGRSYATNSPNGVVSEIAKVARTTSTPLAVRLRRRKQFGETAPGTSDATAAGLTPSEQTRYTRLKATGELPNDSTTGLPLSESQWLTQVNARRSRIRGFTRKVGRSGAVDTQVLGKRVYLPNIILRLVRNNTLPGQPYNPYEATFRIPQSVTKTDLRSLLLTMYGVKTTYIRTDNYISPWYRTQKGKERRPHKTYKRAVVGLTNPFYYPHRLEDMAPEKRKAREEEIEKNLMIQRTRILRKEEMLRITQGDNKASYKLNAPYATKRSHILRIINERRQERENMVSEYAEGLRAMRQEKVKVNYKNLKNRVHGSSSTPAS